MPNQPNWAYAIALLLGATLLLNVGADAQTVGTPPQTPAVPPSITKGPGQQTPAPVALPPRAPDPELDLPDTDTAKRIGGYADEDAVGGADCRTGCDKSYYLCLAVDDSGRCPVSWTQCLTACPAHSSNF